MESNSDSLSSGERNGKSPNRCDVIARRRCHIGVVGPIRQDADPVRELQKQRLVEHSWKAGPEKVTALYTKTDCSLDGVPKYHGGYSV